MKVLLALLGMFLLSGWATTSWKYFGALGTESEKLAPVSNQAVNSKYESERNPTRCAEEDDARSKPSQSSAFTPAKSNQERTDHTGPNYYWNIALRVGYFLWPSVNGWQAISGIMVAVLAAMQYFVYRQQRDISQVTQRAFVGLKRIRFYPIRQYAKPVRYIAFTPVLVNTGLVETSSTVAAVHHLVSRHRIDEDTFDFLPNYSEQAKNSPFRGPQVHFLSPKLEADGPRTNIKVSDLELARRDKSKIYLWGWIDYQDGFDGTPRRRTEFAYEIVVTQRVSNVIYRGVRDGEIFRFARLRKHNGADRDCYRQSASYEDGKKGILMPPIARKK